MASPHTPKTGSPERKAILDELRQMIGEGKSNVIFKPNHLKVEEGWAYFVGKFEYNDGVEEDSDYCWGDATAVLSYENKHWKLKLHHRGDEIQDSAYYIKQFPKAPKAIFYPDQSKK